METEGKSDMPAFDGLSFRTFLMGCVLCSLAGRAVWGDENAADPETLRVVSFSLIDTKTQKPIKHYEKVTKNDKISIGKLPTRLINVSANVEGGPGSVRFLVPQKKLNRVENKAPYSLAGDAYGRFLPWRVVPGKYSLAAVPYSEADGKGDRGEHLRVDVEFTE